MDAHLTSNLKPCPFCGCNDIEGPFPHNQLRLVWVTRCGNPSCEAEHMADSAEETCARWNRRTTQEASGIPSDDLRRLWNAEVDDADKLLTALGLGDKETISEQYRSEGGFLRVGKIVSALKERGIPHEPQGLRSGDRVEWRGCAGKVVNANVAYVTLDSGHSHTLPLDELVRVPLTKGETP